jgi:hypothetical protein
LSVDRAILIFTSPATIRADVNRALVWNSADPCF